MRICLPQGRPATHGEHYTGCVRATQEKTCKKPELTRLSHGAPLLAGGVQILTLRWLTPNFKCR